MPDLTMGAANAVHTCMAIEKRDKVLVLTDRPREEIGRALALQCEIAGAETRLIFMEDHVERPAKDCPQALTDLLTAYAPTASFLATSVQAGELAFRMPYMKHVIYTLKARHGHMVGIDERLMTEGMTADYQEVARLTMRVNEVVREARVVEVQAPSGTDLRATLDPGHLRWHPCPGLYHEPATWGNLPEGETFTCPASIDGIIGAEVLGDYLSERYGVLSRPARFEVEGGWVRNFEAGDDEIQRDLTEYLGQHANSKRAGEFAIGTNIALTKLSGNLLQDEKLPGVHIAFGNPYGEETGADWDCPSHIDVVATRSTIKVDGQYLMRDGAFVF